MDQVLAEFLSGGSYLPQPLREWEDQAKVFLRIHEQVQNAKAAAEKRHEFFYLENMDSTSAHVYTIDHFLWFMAAHGYTLQRSRRPVPFHDLAATMEDWQKRYDQDRNERITAFLST